MNFNNIQILGLMLCAFVLTVFPLLNDSHKKLNQKMAFLSLNIFFWCIAVYLTRNATSAENAIFWASFFPLGVRLLGPAALDFGLEAVNLGTPKWKLIKYLAYSSGIIFYLLGPNKFFYTGAVRYPFGYYTQGGVLHLLWFGSLLLISVLACYVTIRSYRGANNFVKHKLKYFIFAGVIFLFFGCLNALPMYGIGAYPFGTLGGILALIILSYGAIENRLIDINVLIGETALLLVVQSILIAAFVYLVVALNISSKNSLILLLTTALPSLVLISIYIAEKLHSALSRKLENIFPEKYSFRKGLSHGLELLVEDYEHFEINLASVFGSPSVKVIPADSPMAYSLVPRGINNSSGKDRMLVLNDLKSNDHFRAAMQQNNLYMIVPLRLFFPEKSKVIGYLLLDLSLKDKIYMKEDFDLIKMMSYSLALLWFASNAFQKIRIENEALSQSLKNQYQSSQIMSSRCNQIVADYEKAMEEERTKRNALQKELRQNVISEVLRAGDLTRKCKELTAKLDTYEKGSAGVGAGNPQIQRTGLAQVFAVDNNHKDLIDEKDFPSLEELKTSDFFHFYQPDLENNSIEIIYTDPEGNKQKVT